MHLHTTTSIHILATVLPAKSGSVHSRNALGRLQCIPLFFFKPHPSFFVLLLYPQGGSSLRHMKSWQE